MSKTNGRTKRKTTKKQGFNIGLPLLAVLAFGGMTLWQNRADADEGDSASDGILQIEIIPGNALYGIGSVSGDLSEGSYGNLARVTVTNTTKKAGQPYPYTFNVSVMVAVSSITVINQTQGVSFAAGETKAVDFSFDIPLDVYGSGQAFAALMTSDGSAQIGTTAQSTFTVQSVAVIPGGTITW